MITKAMEFWGFKEHPFSDAVLSGDSLEIFVGRNEELEDLENSLHNRITGVYGSLGVGKSSFLHHFTEKPPRKGLPVALVNLPPDAFDRICQEMLAELLVMLIEKKIKINGFKKSELKNEIKRLSGTLAFSRLSSVGAELVFKGTTSEQKDYKLVQHDEASARSLLGKIIKNTTKPFVIILDDFHNLNIGGIKNDNYFPSLDRLITTIDQYFNSSNVAFVITLDEKIENYILDVKKQSKGAFSFSVGDFVHLCSFNSINLYNMIEKRLNRYGNGLKVFDFLTEDAFYGLLLCAEGHPRRALRVIRNAMNIVAKGKGVKKNRIISLNSIRLAADKAGEEFDDIDFKIITYIIDNNSTTTSDGKLSSILDNMEQQTLYHRLENLREKLQLIVTKKLFGKTYKNVYSFEKLS
ncbi:ATP-binding protein [bacterium]|nr:ATP-binding protein [bacterium]